MSQKVEIQVDKRGLGSVLVDGLDVSACVRGFRVEAQAGEMTSLTLDHVNMDHVALSADVAEIQHRIATEDIEDEAIRGIKSDHGNGASLSTVDPWVRQAVRLAVQRAVRAVIEIRKA